MNFIVHAVFLFCFTCPTWLEMMLLLLFMFKKKTVIHDCNIEIFMCMLNAHENLILMNLNKPVYLYRNGQNGLLKAILMSKLCFLGLGLS